jgi:flagellar basal-body rod protein FlgC
MSGLDHLFAPMRIASSGLNAERARIDVISENIANARTTRTTEGGPYRRKFVIFEPLTARGGRPTGGVRVASVQRDLKTPTERILDPSHPDADEHGMIEIPNINTVREMADLMTALRAYEANLTVQEASMRAAERALELAR